MLTALANPLRRAMCPGEGAPGAMTEKRALSVIHQAIALLDFATASSGEAAVAILSALKAAGMSFDPPSIVRARKPTRR